MKQSKDEFCVITEHMQDYLGPTIRYMDDKGKIKKMSFTQYLKDNHADLPVYTSVNVIPSTKVAPGVFNAWLGMKAEKLADADVNQDAVNMFNYTILHIWAAGREDIYKWLIAWFRFLVANPDLLVRTAIYLFGLEGSGKTVIADFLRDWVLGPSIVTTYDGVEGLTERHDTRKMGRRLFVVEEARSSPNELARNMDSMKRIITNKVLTENPKGQTIREFDNIGCVLILSNHVDCITITDTDRRYTVLRADPVHREDRNFWGDVLNVLMNERAGNSVYTWLLDQDPTTLPDPTIVLQTDERKDLQDASRDSIAQFMTEIMEEIKRLEADWLIGVNRGYDINGYRKDHWFVLAETLHPRYISWCAQKKVRNPLSSQTFILKTKSPDLGLRLGYQHRQKVKNQSSFVSINAPTPFKKPIMVTL